MPIITGKLRPACNQDGCQLFFEQECQKCKAPRCDDHIARCIHCWQLARMPMLFCYSCANDHERIKSLRLSGNCLDEWMETVASPHGEAYDFLITKDPETLKQRRIERYKMKGIL